MMTRVKLLDWINPDFLSPTARALAMPCPAARLAFLRALGDTVDKTAISRSPHDSILALLDETPRWVDKVALAANSAPAARSRIRALLSPTDVDVLRGASANEDPEMFAEFLPYMKLHGCSWTAVSGNSTPAALQLMRENIELVSTGELMWRNSNPDADDLRAAKRQAHEEANSHFGVVTDYGMYDGEFSLWYSSYRTAPGSLTRLLAEAPDYINWRVLSGNPSPDALEALRLAPNNINWILLSSNPGVFEECYDYAAMRAAMDPHREALARAAFHPRRLARHLALGGAPEDF